MNDREAIELIWAYCEDRVPPDVFELRFYADDSCMDRVLGERSAAWPPPITSSPYFEILDLSLTRDVARAKQIFRAFLAFRPEREPVSAQQLDEVERRLGVQLPDAYRDFVSRFDPSAIGPRTLRVPQPVPEALRFYLAATLGVHALFAPGLDEGDGTSILSTLPMRREWDLPEGLVLLDGDGHTWLALDYRASALDPPVVFFATDTGRSHVLASSFGEFLRALEPPL